MARAGELVQAAAAAGARLVVLPEKWNWWGPASATASGAEPLDGPSLAAARAWARDLGIAIVAGSVLEAIGDLIDDLLAKLGKHLETAAC